MKTLLIWIALSMTMATTSLFAKKLTSIEKKIIEYQKSIIKRDDVKIKSIHISNSQQLIVKGDDWADDWKAYTVNVKLKFRGKDIDWNEILFSNGQLITRDFVNLSTKESIKDNYKTKITSSHYRDENFLIGNKKAKHKIIVFSDPLCPICKRFTPDLISFAQEHKKELALYYYGFPLTSIHHASGIIEKMIEVTKKDKKAPLDKILKAIYTSKALQHDISDKKAFIEVNKILVKLGANAVTKIDLKNKKMLREYKRNIKTANELMVQGTPTVFTDGQRDKRRNKYIDIIK